MTNFDSHDTQSRDPLASIAARARLEPAPAVDVTAAVLRRLRVVSAADAVERPMLWLAAGAFTAAAIIMFFAMPYISGALDPLTEFMAEGTSTVI